jgi:beta-glucosidase
VPELSSPSFDPGQRLEVRVPVTNVGERHGTEVVQLYVAPCTLKVVRPVKELKAFAKLSLGPGESSVVVLTLDDRSFARWSAADPALVALIERQAAQAPFMPRPDLPAGRGWVVDPGRYDLHVGRSSADIAHVATVEVGPEAQPPAE